MANRQKRQTPTDEEILSYDNVPVDAAARYLGFSNNTIYYALQEERAPFGFAVPRASDATYCGLSYTYYISPAKLVACKRAEAPLPTVGVTELQEELINIKKTLQKLLRKESVSQ